MKNIIYFISVLISLQGFASTTLGFGCCENGEEVTATIYFEDGSTKVGRIDLPLKAESRSIKLRIDDREEKIDMANVKKITYDTPESSSEYHNVAVYNTTGKKIQKDRQLLLLAYSGKYATLYTKMFNWSGGAVMANRVATYAGVAYYCKREAEPAATLIHENFGQANKNSDFRMYAGKYFADYPFVADRIKEKIYTYKDIREVLVEYNHR